MRQQYFHSKRRQVLSSPRLAEESLKMRYSTAPCTNGILGSSSRNLARKRWQSQSSHTSICSLFLWLYRNQNDSSCQRVLNGEEPKKEISIHMNLSKDYLPTVYCSCQNRRSRTQQNACLQMILVARLSSPDEPTKRKSLRGTEVPRARLFPFLLTQVGIYQSDPTVLAQEC